MTTYFKILIFFRKRNKKIIEMRKKGVSFPKIASLYGITKQRIYQIVEKDKYKRSKDLTKKNKPAILKIQS